MSEEEELDYSWIEAYKKIERKYDKFYQSSPRKITVYNIFVNKAKEVEKSIPTKLILDSNSVIDKNSLLSVIEKNKNNKKYSLQKILKYNITLEPQDIQNLTLNKIDISEYLYKINNIEHIKFLNTIEMFQDLNSLFLIYSERSKKSPVNTNKTRKKKNILCKELRSKTHKIKFKK